MPELLPITLGTSWCAVGWPRDAGDAARHVWKLPARSPLRAWCREACVCSPCSAPHLAKSAEDSMPPPCAPVPALHQPALAEDPMPPLRSPVLAPHRMKAAEDLMPLPRPPVLLPHQAKSSEVLMPVCQGPAHHGRPGTNARVPHGREVSTWSRRCCPTSACLEHDIPSAPRHPRSPAKQEAHAHVLLLRPNVVGAQLLGNRFRGVTCSSGSRTV
jgi:hypothetical protein